MARFSPTPSQKLIYIFFIALSCSIIYLDIKSNSFIKVKQSYNASKIIGSYFLINLTKKPFQAVRTIIDSKDLLIEENKKLKKNLENSYLDYYFNTNFDELRKNFSNIDDFSKENFEFDNYIKAEIAFFDPNMFFCCTKHRLFIKTESDYKNLNEAVVFNEIGILGQIISSNKIYEVMLFTDLNHSLPIKNKYEDFFCNAKGMGLPDQITCNFNFSMWNSDLKIGDKIYTSGMGGVYPKNILVGEIIEITKENEEIAKSIISLVNNPIKSNIYGIYR